jgi:hypothetical protein
MLRILVMFYGWSFRPGLLSFFLSGGTVPADGQPNGLRLFVTSDKAPRYHPDTPVCSG